MADVEATVEALTNLKISVLDEGWVKDVWDNDFTDAEPLPLATAEEINSEDFHRQNVSTLISLIGPWRNGQEEKGFWATLMENDFSHRNLIALVFHIMDAGQQRTAAGIQRESALLAAELYFTLLGVPGSSAFKIFHPMLFQKAVDSFKMWLRLDVPVRKRKNPPGRAGRKGCGQKGRKRPRGAASQREEVSSDDDDDEENEDEEGAGLTPEECTAVYKALRSLLKAFVKLLESYSLKDNEQATVHCIQTLTELTKVDPETFHGDFKNSNIHHAVSIPQLAYKGLTHLCTNSQGASGPKVTLVFKYLLPNLLMMIGENKAVAMATIPQHVQLAKDHALGYVIYLVERYGEPVLPPCRVLLQHMCVKAPDKVEYRFRIAAAIIAILKKLPTPSYARMIDWIYRFSRNAKLSYRSFGLSLASLLLAEPERLADESTGVQYIGLLSHRFLIQMILSRCSDIAPTIRARAIQSFASCCCGTDPTMQMAIKDFVTPRAAARQPISRVVPTPDPTRTAPATEATEGEQQKEQLQPPEPPAAAATVEDEANVTPADQPAPADLAQPVATPGEQGGDAHRNGTPGGIILTPGGEISLSDGKGVVSMLRRRARQDDRVNVRKAAIQAIEKLMRLDTSLLNAEDLTILHERCLDPALSVRKQSLQSLTDLLYDLPLKTDLQWAWLDGILQLVMDRETAVQEKCLDTIEETLINNIVPYPRSNSDHHKMAWQLLAFLASNEGTDLRRFLQRACQQLGRMGRLRPTLLTYLQTHVSTENNKGAWMFIAELAPYMKKIPHKFVVNYWNETAKNASDLEYDTVHRVLVVLGHVAKDIDAETASPLAENLKDRLMRFDSPPELIAVTVSTLNKVTLARFVGDESAAKQIADTWFSDLLSACDRHLSTVILDENPDTPIDEDQTVRHLFTLGEIAQLCPDRTPRRAFLIVQSLVAAPVISGMDDGQTLYASGRSAESRPGSQASQVSQSSQASQGTCASSQGFTQFSQATQSQLSQFRGSKMSNRVRAFAFTTLGKLCLQNEDLAKKVVPALARELELAPDEAIRNNITIVLCDLCVRYTSLVDRYVSNVSACLKDSSLLVRKQTLTLITHLLQEDFLKWKGSLFFRFISTLVDESEDLQQFAEFCLIHLLLQRHPGMFFHHFVECVFHFNSYEGHSAYNKFSQTEREKQRFSLKGSANASKRQRIYRFLLEHMADEHRFTVTAKLTQEVLGAVVDGMMPLDSETSALIQDTLFILASKEIKLAALKQSAVDEDAVEPQDMAAAVVNAAKKTLITQVMKKNVIENVVPTVIGLKHMLERQHSPLLKDLMLYLRELVKDYKSEVKDIMSADPQLAKEIEFDLRKFEEQEEERKAEEKGQRERQVHSNTASPVGSPVIQGRPVMSPAGAARSPKVNKTPDRASPRAVIRTPGSAGGTPRLAVRSPHSSTISTPQRTGGTPGPAVGTPKTGATAPPCMNMNKMHTPLTNRRASSISTLAIMNSARKAMERARQASGASTPGSNVGQTKRVGWADEMPSSKALTEEIADSSGRSSSGGFVTPRQERGKPPVKRAISTPSANMSVLGDITFHQGDLSIIPGSPGHTERRNSSGRDVIHLMSPDQPRPKPRTWNIKSPADPVKTRLLPSEDESDPSPPAAAADPAEAAAAGTVKPRREVLAPRRSSRRSSSQQLSKNPTPTRGGGTGGDGGSARNKDDGGAEGQEADNDGFVSLNKGRPTRRRSLRRK